MFLSSGLTKPTAVEDGAEHLYDLCAYIPNVELPGSGHFGVSAATGALAGNTSCCRGGYLAAAPGYSPLVNVLRFGCLCVSAPDYC